MSIVSPDFGGPDWLPLNAAFARIRDCVGSRSLAAKDLHRYLVNGGLRSGVRRFEPDLGGTETSTPLKPEFWTEVVLREAPWAPPREEGNDSCVDVLGLDSKVMSGVSYFFVHRPDLEKLLGPVSDQPSASEAEPAPLKSSRGAKSAYDWEKILIKAAVILVRDGVPESANELVAKVLENYQWPKGEPAKSELNKHINPLYFAAKAALE